MTDREAANRYGAIDERSAAGFATALPHPLAGTRSLFGTGL
jgi:hypothetical protein